MRFSEDIFQGEEYSGKGKGSFSKVSTVTMVLSAVSVLMAVLVIANFDELTARIAIWVADFLSSGFPVLIVIGLIVYFVIKLKWKIHRHFWGW